ncbi:MAG: hypothetical protein ABIK81_04225 [candidate division WOR-3 bacterium]
MKYLIGILFLITLFAFLIFYNLKYVPLRDTFIRLREENQMWQEEISELKKKGEEIKGEEKKFTLTWDELFPKDEIFSLKEEGKTKLSSILSEIVKETTAVYIYNYGTSSLPKGLLTKNWDFAFKKGKAVLDYLILTGLPQERAYLIISLEKTFEGKKLERVLEITFSVAKEEKEE